MKRVWQPWVDNSPQTLENTAHFQAFAGHDGKECKRWHHPWLGSR